MEPATAILGVAVLLFTLAGGYVLGRAISAASRSQARPPHESASPMDRDVVELGRLNRRLEQENNELNLFFVTLPDLIKKLQSIREKRHVAPVLIRLLEVIFEPNQLCVFYRGARPGIVKLVTSKGLPRSMEDQEVEISDSEGRIGIVAQNQLVMDTRDFQSANIPRGETGHASRLQIDLCAPLVDADDDSTLGVITVGRPTRFPRNDKKMIKMVADLGSMAMNQAENHRRRETLANEDGLTHLFNKRYGTERLSLAINDTEQSQRPLSIFLFDIDHFKNFNDKSGHLEGDEVLRRVGAIVKSAIRADDFAVRFGGEEFLVVFMDTDKEGALVAAEKIRRQIESSPFRHEEKQPGGRLTISGGVAAFRTDSRSSTEMVRLADEALYAAKHAGRNRVFPCQTPTLGEEPMEPSGLQPPVA